MPSGTLTAAALRVIKLLVGNRPQTVAELMQATGVTRTAVTEQLNELVAAGFVERSVERLPGRGRPRHLFAATEAAMVLLFAANQRIIIPAIWSAVREAGGEALVRRVLDRVTEKLVEHYSRQIRATDPAERLRQLVDVLNKEGALIDVIENEGELLIHRRSCPFYNISDEDLAVCGVDIGLMSRVVGSPVRRVACRHDGDPCCTFALSEQNGR